MWIGWSLALLGTFLFALKSILIKELYQLGMTVDEVLLWRMLLSAPGYMAVLAWLLLRSSITDKALSLNSLSWQGYLSILALGFIGYFLASWLDLAGLQYISAQLERLTLFTYPIIISLLAAVFLNEPMTRQKWLALGLTYSGIWLLYWQELQWSASSNTTKGLLLVFASACSYSLYVILAKGWILRLGSLAFTSLAMLASSIFVVVYYFSLGNSLRLPELNAWWWLLALAWLSTFAPSFMITAAIGRIGASSTAILGSAGPVMTMILAVWWLAEPSSAMHILATLLVLLGVALVGKGRQSGKNPSSD